MGAVDRDLIRRVVRGLLLLVAAWLVLGLVWVAWAAHAADSGRDRLNEARVTLSPADLLSGQGTDTLLAAQDDFERAADRASSPVVAPLRLLPGIGRQVESLEAVTTAAAQVSGVAADAVGEAGNTLDVAVPTGEGRIQLLEDVATVAEDAAARIAVVDAGPDTDLVGPFREARDELGEELTSVELTMLNIRDAARGMAGVFQGPSRYLLLAANNAEMRAGSGMFLSIGVLTFDGGELELGDMRPSGRLQLEAGVPYTDEDLEARWGFADPNRDWRNLALSPRFAPNAEMASRMWVARGGEPVDGVLAVDALALQSLLGAIGPVDVNGDEVTADTVVPLLVHDQYVTDDQEQRREVLSDVAEAVVNQFDQTSPDLTALADGLRSAASGRHLLLWSATPSLQRVWADVGVGGTVGEDDLYLAVNNDGQNKLDQFLAVEADISTRPVDDGTEVTVEVTLRNDTPAEGEPTYITGESPTAEKPAGTYEGILSLNLPAAARLLDVESYAPAGPDGVSQVAARSVRVDQGEEITEEIRFVMPSGFDSMVVSPSARYPGVSWRYGEDIWSDAELPRHRIGW